MKSLLKALRATKLAKQKARNLCKPPPGLGQFSSNFTSPEEEEALWVAKKPTLEEATDEEPQRP